MQNFGNLVDENLLFVVITESQARGALTDSSLSPPNPLDFVPIYHNFRPPDLPPPRQVREELVEKPPPARLRPAVWTLPGSVFKCRALESDDQGFFNTERGDRRMFDMDWKRCREGGLERFITFEITRVQNSLGVTDPAKIKEVIKQETMARLERLSALCARCECAFACALLIPLLPSLVPRLSFFARRRSACPSRSTSACSPPCTSTTPRSCAQPPPRDPVPTRAAVAGLRPPACLPASAAARATER